MVTAVLEYLCSPGSVHAFSLLRTRRLGAVRKVFVVLPWALQPEHFGWKETKPTKPRNGGDSRWRLQLVIQEINSAVLASPDLIAKLWQLLWHSLFVLRKHMHEPNGRWHTLKAEPKLIIEVSTSSSSSTFPASCTPRTLDLSSQTKRYCTNVLLVA